MDTKERLSESNMYVIDKLAQQFKSDLQNGHKRVAFRKQHVCYGQAGTMVEERLTELQHAAGSRMDTRQWLVQKAIVLNKLDRLVQWLKSDLQNVHKRAAFRKQHVCSGQAGTVAEERLTEWT